MSRIEILNGYGNPPETVYQDPLAFPEFTGVPEVIAQISAGQFPEMAVLDSGLLI
jgi:hypothetical protein